MKILKYIFLLLLLSFISFSVYISTQKGIFSIEKSILIHTSKTNLFNYVNDYQNWEDFMTFMVEDANIKLHYSKTTIGKGSKLIWEGPEANGTIQTLSIKENDSITQKMDLDGSKFNIAWIFKDSIGGTKVTLKSYGEMSFTYKIYSALNGGTNRIIGGLFERSLLNLDRILDFEINTYNIKVNGLVQKTSTPYLKQSFTCPISSVIKNTRIVFPKIIAFCEQNNIELNGKPFVIYHTYDEKSGLANISLCVPIKEGIITSDGSDILSGKLDSFQAVKTTLNGDYSHINKALTKSKSFINQKGTTLDPKFSHLEVYSISKLEIKNPSRWKTEIYVPVKTKNRSPKFIHKTKVPKTETIVSEI